MSIRKANVDRIMKRCRIIYDIMVEQSDREERRESLRKELKELSSNNSVFEKAAKKIGVQKARAHQIYLMYFDKFLESHGLEKPKLGYIK